VRVRYDLATTYQNLANFYAEHDQPARAAEAFQKTQEFMVPLVRDYPERAIYRRLLGRTHFFMGQLHQTSGRLDQARASWLLAWPLQETLVREHPDDSVYQYDLGLTLRSLSAGSQANGHTTEAQSFRHSAQEIESRLIQKHPEANAYYLDAALVYASFSARSTAQTPAPKDRHGFAEDCIARALDLLVDAERSGYFQTPNGIHFLQTARELDHLRSRAGFQQLLARLRITAKRPVN
jgi:hypothetical protein